MHSTLVKNGKEYFIRGYYNRSQDYCNKGERLNPTSLKQKAGGFLNAGVSQ